MTLDTVTFRGGGGTFRGGGEFPLLGSITSNSSQGIHFAVIDRDDEKNPSLLGISPFLVGRCIKSSVGDVEDTRSELDGGRYVVKVRGSNKFQRLLKMECLSDGTRIKVTEHAQLNFSKAVISAPEVAHMSEDEILEELADQHVTEVKRLSKKVSPSNRLASVLVLKIHKPTAPQYITVGLIRKPTRPFYPRPTRCFNCLDYGHIGKSCKKARRCPNCCNAWHDEECSLPTFCLHCNENHSIYSSFCKKFKAEQEIVKIRIDRDIPFPQARRLFYEQRGSYSQVMQQQANKPCGCRCSCSTPFQASTNAKTTANNNTETMDLTQTQTDDRNPITQNTISISGQTADHSKTDQNYTTQPDPFVDPPSQIPGPSNHSKKSGKKNRNNTPVGYQSRDSSRGTGVDSPPRKKTLPSSCHSDADINHPHEHESRRTRQSK